MMLGLLGYGVVGSGVARIIDDAYTQNTASLCIKKILVRNPERYQDKRITRNIDDILNDSETDTVIECIGGEEPALTYVRKALEAHKNVVTSNKKMLALHACELMHTAKENNVRLLYEASCGGGIPWMAELRRIRRIDDISSFEGIFNGTSNYILSAMDEEGQNFADVLKKAKELGYAEQDPSDDIDGYDTRYKTVLSAMSCFDCHVNPEKIPCFGIRNITDEDMAYAKDHDCTIRLIGKGERKDGILSLSVLPSFVKKNSLFGSVKHNFNAICSESSTLGSASFIGQGAGSLPTAHAVVQDVLDLSEKNILRVPSLQECSNNLERKGIFYVRSSQKHETIRHENMNDHAFVTDSISLAQLCSEMKNDREAVVIEVRE